MKRRRFLAMTAVGTVGIGLPAFGWLAKQPNRWQAFAHPELLSLLGNHQRVREIGLTFRRVRSEESVPDMLVDAIMSDGGISEHVSPTDLPALLNRQIRRDFAQGSTIQLDGWILSVTEARQCALYSMLTS